MQESGRAYADGLLRSLRHTGVSLICEDRDLRLLWSRNLPHGLTCGDLFGGTGKNSERILAAKHLALSSNGTQHVEIRLEGDRCFELWIDAETDKDGIIEGLITTAVETTDHIKREQTLKALLREVSHRSKNLLAIVQSIATQTGRFTNNTDVFLTRFRGRIQSLASSQDLVTSSNWRGADLRDLVMGQVGRYIAHPSRAIRFTGADLWLNPNAAMHVGLALHELAVNSVSFGALSKQDGLITLSSHVDAVAGVLTLVWTEEIGAPAGGPADPVHREKRFGSVALERVVPTSLNGSAMLDIGEHQLTYQLTIPSGHFEPG